MQEPVVCPSCGRKMFRDAYPGSKETFVMRGARHDDEIPNEARRAVAHSLAKMLGG